MKEMNINELLESGAHYGHPISKWNPQFKPFIATKKNGIYNTGTGKPRSFQEIADILQVELGTNLGTEYFPNPYDGYQIHTQADISSTRTNLGFEPTISLEEGIKAYIPEIKRLHGEDIS